MTLIATDKKTIVVGLGKTGLSCVRFLAAQGRPMAVVDTRNQPPGIDELKQNFPNVEVHLGPLNAEYLAQADQILLSPGLSPDMPELAAARAAGVEVIGDIELFHRVASAPIVAITGSNGKSTVTTLVGEMARDAGIKVAVGGNLGTPALDLLDGAVELYVLELSSFQLETTYGLGALAATVLNISEDHMDRYPNIQAYYLAKHRIFQGCTYAVVNRDDPLSAPLLRDSMRLISFGTTAPSLNEFGLVEQDGELYLAYGFEALLAVHELRIEGRHNYSNALAGLALGRAAGLAIDSMINSLRRFHGLPHRCQFVLEREAVRYIDDSKGTNVGATLAAIRSIGEMSRGKLVLIAGGDGKGADFSPLLPAVRQWCRAVVLIGRDAPKLRASLDDSAVLADASNMPEAVRRAAALAHPGDVVLLSPACASLDMFKNYEDRGRQFVDAVKSL